MPVLPTSTTVLDSILFRDAFGTPAMREVFSDLEHVAIKADYIRNDGGSWRIRQG